MFNSPLRYPGGKNKLSVFIAKICVDNKINGHYVEPYAGGASVALFLLLNGFVERITINDKDRSIYAFWYSVLNNPDQLCELIDKTDVTINNWHTQREVQKYKNTADLLELGFSTLFQNRTNISGIINGGVMGGVEQNGTYKIDCRFNKQEIVKRINTIASKRNNILLFNNDAIDLINLIESEFENKNTIFYFDPPYFHKASSLYMNHYKNDDHLALSERIKQIKNIRWIVSYDNVSEIKGLYSNYSKKEYSIKHTAYKSRIGKEILFFSNNLLQPEIKKWSPINFKYKKTETTANILYKALGEKTIILAECKR